MPRVLIVEAIRPGRRGIVAHRSGRSQRQAHHVHRNRAAKFAVRWCPEISCASKLSLKLENPAAHDAHAMEGLVYVGAKRVAEAIVSCQLVQLRVGGADRMALRKRTKRNHKALVWRNGLADRETLDDPVADSSSSMRIRRGDHRSQAPGFIPPAKSAPYWLSAGRGAWRKLPAWELTRHHRRANQDRRR